MFLMFANSWPSSKSRSLRVSAVTRPLDPDQLGDRQPYRLPDGRMACAPASCQFEEAAYGSLILARREAAALRSDLKAGYTSTISTSRLRVPPA